MSIEFVRQTAMSLPHATEHVQWGNDLVFKVGGKMFAVMALEPAAVCVSFKCSPEEFADLVEQPGIIPAPYLARASWVALERWNALPRSELGARVVRAHELVSASLTKAVRKQLGLS